MSGIDGFLIFVDDDARYEQGSLSAHLSYLERWGGSPDCWASAYDIFDAVDTAREGPAGRTLVIVDSFDYRVVGRLNKETEDATLS